MADEFQKFERVDQNKYRVRDGVSCPACESWFVSSYAGGKPHHPGMAWIPALHTERQHRCLTCLHYWKSLYWEERTP